MNRNNKVLKNIGISFFLMLILANCGTTIVSYRDTQPEFDLQEYFTGELKGWGLVKNFNGKVTKRFTVNMTGKWDGNTVELYELFKYQDGAMQERTWYLNKQEDGINTGIAGDVVGKATGKQEGFAFNWKYNLLIETNGDPIKVHLNDWLYQISEDAVISEAKIKKFGFTVGEVIVFIHKQDVSS